MTDIPDPDPPRRERLATLTTGEHLAMPFRAWSPSALNAFEYCPKGFEKQYIGRARKVTTSQLAEGSAHHEWLNAWGDALILGVAPLDLPGALVLWNEAWTSWISKIDDWGRDEPDGIRVRGNALVVRFIEVIAPRLSPIAVEAPFHMKVQGLPVNGWADFIDATTVRDWKVVGPWSPYTKQESADTSVQLSTYARAFGKEKVAHVVFDKENGDIFSRESVRVASDFADMEIRYLTAARAVSRGEFPDCVRGSRCSCRR